MSQKYNILTVIPEDVNILLVGESNAGKSTFAHAFANYIKYGQFSVAEENKVSCLPLSFLYGTNTNYIENFKFQSAQFRGKQNANLIPTKNACSYIFPLPKYGRRIHIIDTPGFDDVLKETDNFESILNYVGHIENLHAVCFVLKPNSSTEMLVLQYRLKFLLSRLEKSARKNVIFLFTHSREPYYSHESTDTVLKGIVDQTKSSPSQAEIKYGKENVFCLDNEAFHFLISAAGHGNTIKKTYSEIWSHSVAECWRMIEYVLGCEEITPHKVKNTVLLYNARKIISQASQFLVDIADIIEHLCGFVLTGDILLNRKIQHTPTFQDVLSSNDIVKVEELMVKIEHEKSDYKNHKQTIESVLRNLVVFVRLTAMLSHNDSHEAYIKHLINQEMRQTAEKTTNPQAIINYHGLLKQYTEEIRIINTNVDASPVITATDLLEGIEELRELQKIKENLVKLRDVIIVTK